MKTLPITVTLLATAGLLLSAPLVYALPNVQQVQKEIAQQNWRQASAELTQVIAAHPDNAHAHYLYGQVLAREGQYAQGLAQIEQAKALDPQIRFTDPSHFAQVEATLRAAAKRVPATTYAPNPFAQTQPATQLAHPSDTTRHGPSMLAWISLAGLLIMTAFVLRWTLRRARATDDGRANDERRAQLKRATALLNTARALKLDARLASEPAQKTLANDVEAVETQLRALIETLVNSPNPAPPYEIEDLDRKLIFLKARVEGRSTELETSMAASNTHQSVYAQEAERLREQPGAYPSSPSQPPVVVVQQGGGGFGAGMGGLLTGVLLGEALSRGSGLPPRGEDAPASAGSFDVGQGANDWNDGGNGNFDMGSDDSGGWGDNS